MTENPTYPISATDPELARLAALASYRILDTAPEEVFNDLVSIAAEICDARMALISFIDEQRQWFKAALGVPGTEMPREGGFCAHAMTQTGLFLVKDSTQDPMFANHPVVSGTAPVRFYAGVALLTPEGLALGTLCVMATKPRDLTRRQGEALAALARQVMSQLHWRKALFTQKLDVQQTIPNLAWIAAPSGLLEWFNDRTYDYTGAHRGELAGTGWMNVVHADDRALAHECWTTALRSGEPYKAEFRLRRADGAYRWHIAQAQPIQGADGTISRWVGTNTDIHDRKLAEVAGAQDRERIWNLSQDFMMVCDFESVIRAVNPAAARILGFSREAIAGQSIVNFLHPEDLGKTSAAIAKLACGENTLTFENRLRDDTLGYRLLSWTTVAEGQRIHCIGRDVTEQRATEEALRQAQKMEAVGQLTGGIAHDFNNLLQGITGSLELVKKRLLQGRAEDVERFIDGAMTSASRASALTHRLLAFSRRQPLAPRAVQGNPLLSSMEDLLRRTLGERVSLELVLAGGLWLTKCDPNQLENAVLNLAINARDAMPEGGKLTIETCNCHLDTAYVAKQKDLAPGQYTCISVTDTGTGMSADIIEKAFEPFFTTKPTGQGTGLGLSMIYGFAKQSAGYAKIYSEVGLGTTVKLYLPRYRGELLAPEAPVRLGDLPRAQAQELVLVVEDETVVRGLILDVLKELGYQTLEADDGPAGLALLQSKLPIDLLITDVGLPGLNGRQIAEAGRVIRPGLRVLFLTGYAGNAVIGSGFLEPGMAMITKPFAMEQLARRVREILTR